MSLHCPATLVLARHARADFVESWFSDEGGSLTRAGRSGARDLGAALAERRVAAVYTSDISRSVQTGEIAAAVLWASLSHIDMVAVADGKVVPLGQVKVVQPLETSAIHAIHVDDGDHVHAGDLLV